MSDFVLNVNVLNCSGVSESMLGLSLNKKQNKDMFGIAKRLASKDFGHNKFLESIYIWLEVNAPRYWWQEADTYRLSTKQSESTIHTLIKDIKSVDDIRSLFEPDSISDEQLFWLLNFDFKKSSLYKLKRMLPEGFLQKRMWCMSLKTLRNVILQRYNHNLPHWNKFIVDVLTSLPKEYFDLLGDDINGIYESLSKKF